jgi:hypothetical protein
MSVLQKIVRMSTARRVWLIWSWFVSSSTARWVWSSHGRNYLPMGWRGSRSKSLPHAQWSHKRLRSLSIFCDLSSCISLLNAGTLGSFKWINQSFLARIRSVHSPRNELSGCLVVNLLSCCYALCLHGIRSDLWCAWSSTRIWVWLTWFLACSVCTRGGGGEKLRNSKPAVCWLSGMQIHESDNH